MKVSKLKMVAVILSASMLTAMASKEEHEELESCRFKLTLAEIKIKNLKKQEASDQSYYHGLLRENKCKNDELEKENASLKSILNDCQRNNKELINKTEENTNYIEKMKNEITKGKEEKKKLDEKLLLQRDVLYTQIGFQPSNF
ncbi:MAG: hypothetical protein LBP31_03375 [Holosporales bacterium]|jgi:hypothetical protein|nr:hypothetical protein [Holosporales bacterium]